MIVNDGFEGGRNDDHENVERNCETPKTFFERGLLISSSFAYGPFPFSVV